MPAGLDAVLDVDVTSLRRLDVAPELYALLPEGVRRSLDMLSQAPLSEVDALGLGVLGLGTPQVEGVLVGRGRLSEQHLREALLSAAPGAVSAEYHGTALLETTEGPEAPPGSGRCAAMLTPRTAVLGSRTTVRQVIDNFHAENDNDRNNARGQGELMKALGRAPGARTGRPAVLLALLPSGPFRKALREADLADLGAEASYLAAALAVGDGIDLGAVAGYAELAAARDVVQQLQERVRSLRRRPALTLLRLGHYLDPFIAVAALAGPRHDLPEVHIAFRLPGTDLHALLQRISTFRALRERIRGPAR